MLRSAIIASLLAACAGEGEIIDEEGAIADEVLPLDDVFEAAAAEFAVPPDLLKAIGYAETRWEMVEGHEEFDGRGAAHGIMALRGDGLAQGAALAGVSESAAQTEPVANIRAAAALLSAAADDLGVVRSDLAAWAPAVAQISDIGDLEGQYAFVAGEVYRAMNEGTYMTLEGDFLLAQVGQHDVVPALDDPGVVYAASADYPPAIWRPSPNYNSRPSGSGGKVQLVIIHTCEGSYAGCWGWLKNPAAGASAHYVVNSSGSEITQLVREANRAWHIAASYLCSRNGNVLCSLNGASSNNFTVGIEHAGFASQASWPAGQIQASAKLVCDITKGHGIPRDRHHVVGHGQLQPYNRTDPGKQWPWTDYMARIKAACNDGGTPPPGGGGTLIIDSNNGNNDTSKGKMEVSGNWVASNSTPGYYGSGYWWASTESVSDGATFLFFMPSAGTRTIDAWWTAGTNRSASTPFVMMDASGAVVGKVFKDQRSGGKQWVSLGTYSFKAGWNKVVVSRWTGAAGVVVADAIRVR